ncbi:G patch domain-containing protein 4-like [Dendronephthya gigantea]|uniref:G patch domain-containing protein 4-like n=1 Tax=Dendronephthya gigantea TaxID=151771 RepID=UPI00106BF390|nr:G patch domain-containing protein 4-like [Dendronephthya gigantea]
MVKDERQEDEETAVSERYNCGLDFAKNQLQKHGWSEGKGLGKDESGRANAIKVGVKNNKLGVGFDVGKEFTNNWWDQLFNKAASNIVVEQSEKGVQVSKKDDGSNDIVRPKKLWRVKRKELYYGRFVKATNDGDAFLPSTLETPEVKANFTDEEIFKACGGRTAHKSARHGHKLNGKLKRVADQEGEDNPYEKIKMKRKKRSRKSLSSVPIKDTADIDALSHNNCDEEIEKKKTLQSEMVSLKCSTRKRRYDSGDEQSKSLQPRFEEIHSECDQILGMSVTTKKVKKKVKKKSKKLSKKAK